MGKAVARGAVVRVALVALGLAAAATLLLVATPSLAAQRMGDWPCIQRKVPRLSLGQMWSGPEAHGSWRDDKAVRELAARLASRRLPTEEAKGLVVAFAREAGADKGEKLSLLFTGVFEIIDGERAKVMAGIERYSKRQQALADRIREEGVAVGALRDKAKAEPSTGQGTSAADDALEEAQQKLDWDTRIYQEREQSLTFVCEVPVLYEQRAFAIARLMLQELQ